MANVSRLDQSLDRSHTGLVLFDVLHGYLHPADPAKAAFLVQHNILTNLRRLLAGARRVGVTVFYPAGAHAPDGSDTVDRLTDTDMELGRRQSGDPAIRPQIRHGSMDSQIAAELAPAADDVVVPKNRWNAFFETNLELQLRVRGIDTIVLAGGSTDVGIASTAFAARDLDLGLVIVRDACFSMRGNNNDFFMERVFPRMGRVMAVDDTVRLMAGG
jgi:ureidoacrylate peracid hydrolase